MTNPTANSMFTFLDDDISLDEESHTYSLKSDPEFGFTSCTTFISEFFDKFDAVAVADKLVHTVPKYRDRTPESLIEEWEQTAIDGTAVHKEIEDYIHDGTEPSRVKSQHGVNLIKQYVDPERFHIFPEVIVYCREAQLAGTIDLIAVDKATDTVFLYDWKTNKKIDKSAYRGKKGVGPGTYELDDCKFNHYSVQLSLYRYILEKYHDVTVGGQALVHLTDLGAHVHGCPYLQPNVTTMLQHNPFG